LQLMHINCQSTSTDLHCERVSEWYLVVCVELLVLPLALPEGLPLGLQGLGQVGVLQALLGVLLRQHLDLPLEGTQLLPANAARKHTTSNQTFDLYLGSVLKTKRVIIKMSTRSATLQPPQQFQLQSLVFRHPNRAKLLVKDSWNRSTTTVAKLAGHQGPRGPVATLITQTHLLGSSLIIQD